MSKEKLLSLVDELEKELGDSGLDNELHEKLIADLEALKNVEIDKVEDEHTPLLDAVVHLEESHPKAVTIINDIAHLLSNIGI
jgi:hypothetical protein